MMEDVTQMAQISQILCSIGWTRMGTDIVNDNKSELTTTNLEFTTTWTTKTTRPLATVAIVTPIRMLSIPLKAEETLKFSYNIEKSHVFVLIIVFF